MPSRVVPAEEETRKPTRKQVYVADAKKTLPRQIPDENGILKKFVSNHVVTSKYTAINFLPKFLVEQFRKLANVWFLLVSILELIPQIAISAPGTGTAPTLIFMIFLEALAQLAEDSKRKKADGKANASITQRYSTATKQFEATTWADICCGDVIKMYSYETFPADLLCLCSSDGLECYVETKSLDGETNLKLRSAPKVTYDAFRKIGRGDFSTPTPSRKFKKDLMTNYGDEYENDNEDQEEKEKKKDSDKSEETRAPRYINDRRTVLSRSNSSLRSLDSRRDSMAPNFHFHVEDSYISDFIGCVCDGQDPRDHLTSDSIDTFQGKIILNSYLSTLIDDETASSKGYPLSNKNICLRGCTLRNTDFMYGLVVNTGNDTKIMKSATTAPSKQSDLDRSINHLLIIFLGILLFTCIIGTALNALWVKENKWWEEILFGGGVGIGGSKGTEGSIGTVAIFGQLFITMAQMIPISLYVTMKMARVFQTYFMTRDENMIHVISSEFSTNGEEMIIKPKVRTVDLNDDIGQISYIFSDKTGTLTQNIMEFRKCSINGISYGKGTTAIGIAALIKDGKLEEAAQLKKELEKQSNHPHPPYCNLIDDNTTEEKSIIQTLAQTNTKQSNMISFFFQHLSICHSVSVENVYEEMNGKRIKTKKTRLSASSPDEQALVAGAVAMGQTFIGDTTTGGLRRMVRKGPPRLNGEKENMEDGTTDRYTLLDVLEFTSKRKRMSTIVLENGDAVQRSGQNDSTGTDIEPIIRIYCKGADNVIFERLKKDTDPILLNRTKQHLSMYAEDGLRTLAIATAIIPIEKYNDWKLKFSEILLNEEEEKKRKLQLPNQIDDIMNEIEKDLELIGATAIEDKLQDGVPDAVADLAKAGIKVWVLTGDKQETAINIGFATQLLRRYVFNI